MSPTSLKQFREAHLDFQNKLLAEGLNFKRHYIMSTACVPSRASMLTGHYPSLHGTSQTVGTAKEDFEPDMFWLDPNSVPTVGNYLRAAGYLTFWIGKWHVSASNMMIPGTHEPLVSFDPETGARDPAKEKLYQAANRLNPFGFAGWIGPEAHGSDPSRTAGLLCRTGIARTGYQLRRAGHGTDPGARPASQLHPVAGRLLVRQPP